MAEPKDMPLTKGEFASSFKEMQPAIVAEWPQVDPSALAATDGDLERAVSLIAEQTAHTKALIRRQLEELHRVLFTPPPRPRSAAGQKLPESVDALLHDLEQRASHLLRDLRGGMLNDARSKVTDNLILSLMITLGLGFIVGVVFTGWGRGK